MTPILGGLLRRLKYGKPIVLVSGLPRSGTSMAMKMLAAGGLEVVTDEGETLGRLEEVLELPANDVYVVRSEKGEVLLPAIDDVIVAVDLPEQRMTVHLLPGLIEETGSQ